MAISTNLSVPPCCIVVMAGRGLTGANSVRRAPLGTLLPPRVIPAKAGTQLYRYYAKLALGPRFRGDDALAEDDALSEVDALSGDDALS